MDELGTGIISQIEAIASESYYHPRMPGAVAQHIFMGGEYSHDTLIENPWQPLKVGHISQYTLTFSTPYSEDLEIEKLWNATLLPNPVNMFELLSRGNKLHPYFARQRSFILAPDGLYVHHEPVDYSYKDILLPPSIQQITGNLEIAARLLQKIHLLPINASGIDLYRAFLDIYISSPNEFPYELADKNHGYLDFDTNVLIKKVVTLLPYVSAKDRQLLQDDLAWQLYYKGKVPASWSSTKGIVSTIHSVKKESPLVPLYVDAAITHPNLAVADAICAKQRLSSLDFAKALANYLQQHNISKANWKVRRVILRQQLHGMTRQEVTEATAMATTYGRELFPYVQMKI